MASPRYGYQKQIVDEDGNVLGTATHPIATSAAAAGDNTIDGPLGRAADAASVSAALSTEDVALVGALTETAPATDTASSGLNGRLQRIAQRFTSLIALLPTALGANGGLKVEGVASGTAIPASQSGTWTVQPGNTANTTAWLTKASRSSTATHTNVNDTNASTTILASNANRLGASVHNDSTAILYLDTTGGTASTTNYTTQLQPGAYYEVPFNYTGLITGIWSADASGAARIVEYT